MSHLYLRANRNECFWNQISTGVAAHTDLQAAIVSAILEVVERDAIALTWLTRLPLAEVLPGGGEAVRLRSLVQRSGCRYSLFDATTDVGIPTIYGLQRRPHHTSLAQLVACASGYNAAVVYRKVLFELAQLNHVDWASHSPPEDPRDILLLEHGASYMASPERSGAFDFLAADLRTRKLEHFDVAEPSGYGAKIADLKHRLTGLGYEVYLVNLTTDDLVQAGVHVVRAIIPGLLPMSPLYRARYLGHPRLYDYARKMGLYNFSERDVNPYPQPFA
jgi:ribosomal protein S12 methylthiotransferase accessory factor